MKAKFLNLLLRGPAVAGLAVAAFLGLGPPPAAHAQTQPTDWGDAPTNNFPTTAAANGARHIILQGFQLGVLVDPEGNGQPNGTATGDDVNPTTGDDEDGVVFLTPLNPGDVATVQVTCAIPVGTVGRLDAWMDFNADGDWADTNEKIFNSTALANGVNTLNFVVPATAPLGATFARFRLSRQGGLNFNGAAADGEVEDYRVVLTAPLDFGDAPDPTYPTLLRSDGARHTAVANFCLGTKVDIESDGQPDAAATGDDNNPSASDDEDGVVFVTPLVSGELAKVDVTATVAVGTRGFLTAWVDFNGNGTWADPGEQIFIGVPLDNGVNNLEFVVPPDTKPGPTFARFRMSRQTIDIFAGFGGDGEVEDYQVSIQELLDFGDAPDQPYPTLRASNGASHTAVQGFHLGQLVDAEPDGQPTPGATGDDFNPSAADDEDGVTFPGPLFLGQSADVQVFVTAPAGLSARLDAWIDFNADGDWTDPGEQIFTAVPVNNGPNTLTFNVPDTKSGSTFARFRLSRQGGLRPEAFGGEGEVEDYRVALLEGMDFSDAPDQPYPTVLARNGARHVIVRGFHLGEFVDAEPDGQPTSGADGDDANPAGVPDDEDGVNGSGPVIQGRSYTVQVTAAGVGSVPAYLQAWIDFNGNGSWADPGEQIFTDQLVSDGVNSLNFNVPATAKVGETYARFRLSRGRGLSFDGPALNGEVEDYRVPIISDRDRCDLSCDGRDFWLTFPGSYNPDPDNRVRPSLCIVGASGVTGTVAIPGLGFSTNFTIPAALSVSVPLPRNADLGDLNDSVTNKGIHVTASADVAIYAISKVRYSSDSYLALSSSIIGTEYIVLGWANVHSNAPPLNGSQFAIVAAESNTTVTITPSYPTGGHPKGVPYNLILQAGDTYQLRSTNDFPADLTGTVITSDKPIAVFGSHRCANVPSTNEWFCDYLVEQLPPVNHWGINFFTAPLATRTGGDTFRCLASEDNTTLSINGAPIGVIDRGGFRQFTLASAAHITADKPILVAQYANSADFDPPAGSFSQGDPFMSIVQATRHYENSYTVCSFTNGFGGNYLNIIAPAGIAGSVTLNGVLIGAGAFNPIGASGFAYARVSVTAARNTVAGPAPLGVSAYGWNQYESYGHPACFHVGDVRPPTIVCNETNITIVLAGATANCFAAVPDIRETVTADDNCAGRQGITIRQVPDPGSPVGPGVHTITVIARDSSGNTATCTTTLTVIDPSPVNIFCPSNIVANCTSSNGARVQYSVTARSTCDTNVPVVCNPASGSPFPPGITTVVCNATSLAGQTDSCSFTVDVRCGGKLTIVRSDTRFTVNWTGSPGTLEAASSLTGPWRDVISGVNSYSSSLTSEPMFFRVRY